jgi:hypothetical protein
MLDATRERTQPMKMFWILSKGAAVGSVVGYEISTKRSNVTVIKMTKKA